MFRFFKHPWISNKPTDEKSLGCTASGSDRRVEASHYLCASYTYEGFGKIVGQNCMGGGAYLWCGLWGYRNDWDAG
ncbi:MAG: hypothetical protein NZ959_09960 [Armatimonadetes bacterium]|nr:hypothetical protein [Armatimonadota bacterium]MDW8123096.1 hypothetical protein [Armatimonadota bacterium]